MPNNEETVGSIFGHKYDPRTHEQGVQLVDSKTLIGIEVELENVRFPAQFPILQKSPFWEAEKDHSLRGNSVEWKFAFPLRGHDVEYAVKELEHNILLHCNPVKSDRTSTHVHININDLSKYQLYRFILLSITLERLLYHYAGEHRANSIFCVPFYKSDLEVDQFKYLIDNTITMKTNTKNLMSNDYRYSGINMAAIRNYGTLEFRMLDSEWNATNLLRWINILLLIKNYAINLEQPMVELHKELSRTGMGKLVSDVFGEYESYFKYSDMEFDVLKGLRLAQQVEYSNTNLNLVWRIEPLAQESSVKVKPNVHSSFFPPPEKTAAKIKKGPGPYMDLHFNQEHFVIHDDIEEDDDDDLEVEPIF